MIRVLYLAGPFRHPKPEMMAAHTLTAQFYATELAKLGVVPYCPHSNLGHAYGQIDEGTAERINDEFLRRSDALVLLPGWGQSVGARRELEHAKRLGLPVFRSLDEVRAWQQR